MVIGVAYGIAQASNYLLRGVMMHYINPENKPYQDKIDKYPIITKKNPFYLGNDTNDVFKAVRFMSIYIFMLAFLGMFLIISSIKWNHRNDKDLCDWVEKEIVDLGIAYHNFKFY